MSCSFTKLITLDFTLAVVTALDKCITHLNLESLLGIFTKLQKATISVVMSVCPSVHTEQLSYHCTYFHKILYFNIFKKSVGKIQFDYN
jgi:hypothetical protein